MQLRGKKGKIISPDIRISLFFLSNIIMSSNVLSFNFKMLTYEYMENYAYFIIGIEKGSFAWTVTLHILIKSSVPASQEDLVYGVMLLHFCASN